jgi:hypothetical protein
MTCSDAAVLVEAIKSLSGAIMAVGIVWAIAWCVVKTW